MPQLRSRTVTHGRNMAGARALMRASGVASEDIGKPIIAVANSFTEFVPGHTHLAPVGRIVSEAIKAAGAVPREFNTIAVDDGIAMGHGGMLYSLPSRDLIADSVEYMVEAHCADALICISNCDKITPGMLMAALRLNIPTVFVSGGPMEAGKTTLVDGTVRTLDLVDAISDAVDDKISDADILRIEENACPTCGSCSGMFTANSMNCLAEAIGLALPGNGSVLATHTARKALYENAARTVVEITERHYERGRPLRPAPQHRHPRGLRERHGPRHRHGRLHQHDPPPAGRRPGGRARLRPGRDRRDLPPGPLPREGRPQRGARRDVLHGGRAPRGRHPRHPRRAAPGRPAQRGRPQRARGLPRRVAQDVGRARGFALRRGRSNSGTRRPAASARRPPSPSRSAGTASTRTRRAAASTRSSTPTPRTAGSRSSRATWPWTAAS